MVTEVLGFGGAPDSAGPSTVPRNGQATNKPPAGVANQRRPAYIINSRGPPVQRETAWASMNARIAAGSALR